MLKRFLAGAMAVALTVTMVTGTYGKKDVKGASNQWKIVWSDDFEGTELDQNNWNVEVNGYGGWNNELQYYSDRKENVKVDDGKLILTARKESYEGMDYTSSRLNTLHKVDFGYGKLEAKIKLPKFSGAFPAFWMLGANYDTAGYPACGEIDVVETINDESLPYGTAHWPYEDSLKSSGSQLSAVGASVDTSQWHTYGVIRDENSITWYVDDIQYHRVDLTSDPNKEALKKDMCILLNFAIGGEWPGFDIDDSALPATMEVDYVRIYERDGSYVPVTEKEDAITTSNVSWTTEVADWARAEGSFSVKSTPAEGFSLHLDKIGNSEWGVQASLLNLNYRAGYAYTYECTLLSDIDKRVFVKLQGDGTSELTGDYVDLKAGVPYKYTTSLVLPYNYTGAVSPFFAFGLVEGENLTSDASLNLSVSDVSLYTYVEKEIASAPQLSLDGFQFSTTLNGFRTIYSLQDAKQEVTQRGMVYGLGALGETDMVVHSSNPYVYTFEATDAGKLNQNYSELEQATSYAMTMRCIPDKDFYNHPMTVRAYAKLADGSYIYSDTQQISVYQIADTLYQGKKMNTQSGHTFLYDHVLKVVNPNYTEIAFDFNNRIAG